MALVAVPHAYACGQVGTIRASCVGMASGMKPPSKVVALNRSLLSKDRKRQSQFCSLGFGLRQKPKPVSLLCSVKSELALDANKGNVIDVAEAEVMEKYIAESGEKMVVVDISTSTCGPCKLIFPKVVKMSTEYPEVLFLKINGDTNNGTRALMRKWGVKAVPSFRFFRNGIQIHSHVGAKEDELRAHFLTHYTALNISA